MKKAIIAACLMGLPVIGLADITINAYATVGGIASLYDASGTVVKTGVFSSTGPTGMATTTISTAGLNGNYGISVQYDPNQNWRSYLAWSDGAASPTYNDTQGYYDGISPDLEYTVLSGAITGRAYNEDTGAMSVVLTGNGLLSTYTPVSSQYELDADISLYRPATYGDLIGGTLITKRWSSAGASNVEINPGSFGFSEITMTNDDGSQYSYIGTEDALSPGSYDIEFFRSIEAEPALDSGSVLGVIGDDNSVEFISVGATPEYEDFVPYYVMTEDDAGIWLYTDEEGPNGTVSVIRDDAGLVLSNPDYVIPEPAVLMLVMGGGGLLLIGRRFFNI